MPIDIKVTHEGVALEMALGQGKADAKLGTGDLSVGVGVEAKVGAANLTVTRTAVGVETRRARRGRRTRLQVLPRRSGVEEFGWVGERELAPAMAILATLGVPLLVHAELAGPIDEATAELARAHADPRRYATYLASRPGAAEEQAIALVTGLCRSTGARTHIVHHSAASALRLLRDARAQGLPLTAETCPHYLHFTVETIPDGATPFKCAPPIREHTNREALWAALAEGVLDLVASDHSPCSPGLKAIEAGDFVAAWGGVSGLQLALPVVWTEASARGHTLADIARWIAAAPARLAGLTGRKCSIVAGADADLLVFDDDAHQTITPDSVHHRHKVTPYAGETLRGIVHATYLRGELVAEGGRTLATDLGALV